MYNRFEKGLQPRQSVTDYLMAVKEESQQLEEELESLEEVRVLLLFIFSCAPVLSITSRKILKIWNINVAQAIFKSVGQHPDNEAQT
jgi:hypothetical protein